MMSKGTLFLVPNTLGELHRETQIKHVIPDEVARQASQIKYWIVENAKTARAFLKAIHHFYPLIIPLQEIQMVEWSGPQSNVDIKTLLAPLQQGHHLGLLSEAGLPAIADPGTEVVALAHLNGIKVKPLCGPSSILMALMASGLNGQKFSFHGYLAIKSIQRTQALKLLEQQSKKEHSTQIWIETPYRNLSMLESCLEVLSANTHLCIAAQLSLEDEMIIRKSIGQWKTIWFNKESEVLQLEKKPAVFLLQA